MTMADHACQQLTQVAAMGGSVAVGVEAVRSVTIWYWCPVHS